MYRDRGIMPKSKKHLSAPNSFIKPNRRRFRRLSRSSSLSSDRTSSEQSKEDNALCISQSVKDVSNEDKDSLMKKLQSQVKELRNKLKMLEECIENKEYSLGTIAREKDRALGEIRRLERNNKQLRQQLNDERNHYLEEKEKFCEEMTRYKKRLQEMKTNDNGNKTQSVVVPLLGKISAGTWQKGDSAEIRPEGKHLKSATAANLTKFRKSNSLDSVGLYEGQDFSLQMAALRTENAKLRAIVNEREERNYELCVRFLRMKHSKNDLRNRFQDLENEYLQVITILMEKIDEAREEFNFIIDQKFKKPLHSNNAKYLKMVQRNSKVALENVTLRMELQNLKKELNKLNCSQGDYGRKVPDEERNNLAVDEKSRKSARQARNGTPALKASDTDSNYMSKTSTTGPSTGSLADAKSNESISADGFDSGGKSKTPNSQNLFSEDILHKLFERVDSHSILNSKKDSENENCTTEAVSNNDAKNRGKRKSDDQVKSGQNLQPKEIPPLLEEGLGKRFVPCSLNSKKFHEVTTQSATKKIAPGRKDKRGIQPMDDISDKDKFSETCKSRRRISETGARPKSPSRYAEVKDRIRSYPDSDKTADSDRERTSVKGTSSWNKMKDKKVHDRIEGEEIRGCGSPRRYRSRKERRQRVFVRDSCGLEEKLDTDGEVSPDYIYQVSGRKSRSEEVVDQLAMVKHKTPEDDDIRQRTRERVWSEVQAQFPSGDSNSEDSAFGSNSAQMRHRNSISLHDELMEVTKSQSQKDDPFWRRELNLHSLITEKSASSSKTYRLNGRNSRFMSEGHTPENVEEDDPQHHKVLVVETKVLRKNHDERERSRSQSPHQSKPGSENGLPLDMGHNPRGSNPTDKNNEFVLRFLMPPATILSTQSLLFDDTSKEPSLNREKDQGSPPHTTQHQLSQLMLPGSNMASSGTTIEMGDSPAARENVLASRTLSTPGLIESGWLNTFKMCEMKDCSTNTRGRQLEMLRNSSSYIDSALSTCSTKRELWKRMRKSSPNTESWKLSQTLCERLQHLELFSKQGFANRTRHLESVDIFGETQDPFDKLLMRNCCAPGTNCVYG